jgi:hypothetical protein
MRGVPLVRIQRVYLNSMVIRYNTDSSRMSAVSDFPRKHARSLRRRPSLAFGVGTFADAKDQASLPLDGLLREILTPCSHDFFDYIVLQRQLKTMSGQVSEKKQ